MFVWVPIPKSYPNARSFTRDVIRKTGVLVTPGDAFGEYGEGYIRIALVQEHSLIIEAANRLAAFYKEIR
jgi:aspartate/methionine/tyrosine aminotransferase